MTSAERKLLCRVLVVACDMLNAEGCNMLLKHAAPKEKDLSSEGATDLGFIDDLTDEEVAEFLGKYNNYLREEGEGDQLAPTGTTTLPMWRVAETLLTLVDEGKI